MSIKAGELFELARKVELRVAKLYEDMATRLTTQTESGRFFARLAAQEHMHASWVDELMALVERDVVIDTLSPKDFTRILSTLEDVHDEVLTDGVNLLDALEIIVHLEGSVAEEFYKYLPEDVPGLPRSTVQRMIKACENHAQAVEDFRDHVRDMHQQGLAGEGI